MSNNTDEILTEGYALSEMHKRFITSLAIGLVASISLLLGGWLFTFAILVVAWLMDREWGNITPDDGLGWKIFGIAYVALPCIAALALRDLSLAAIIYPVLIVIATDIGAYLSGKTIGGPKLLPAISPNKTWAGLLGGMAAAMLVAVSMHSYVPLPASTGGAIVVGALLAIIAQAGDFFESWLKRREGIKDSGTLLPGHGGLLDRLDGYIFTLPCYLLYLMIAAELVA